MTWAFRVAVAIFCAGLGTTCAHAEVGKASANPGEWFLGFNGGGGWAQGPERQAFHKVTPILLENLGSVNFDDGAFYLLGFEAGYVFAGPASLIDRIEFNADLHGTSRDLTRNPRAAAVNIADGPLEVFTAFSGNSLEVDGNDDQSDIELRLSFKNTVIESDSHFLIASIEPFVRFQETDSQTRMGFEATPSSVQRRDDIRAEYYGVQLALEVERLLTDSLSLIGRASAGAYYADANIETQLSTFDASDSDDSWGGRFGGAFGIKVPLNYAGASLTLMGTIDYLTDVATIDHASSSMFVAQGETKADFDDALDVGGRIGLVFPLR